MKARKWNIGNQLMRGDGRNNFLNRWRMEGPQTLLPHTLLPKPSDFRILSDCGSFPPKRYESIQFQSSFPKRGLNHGPLPHPRETLVEGEAGDLIPSLPFAKAGFREEDARGTCIVVPGFRRHSIHIPRLVKHMRCSVVPVPLLVKTSICMV